MGHEYGRTLEQVVAERAFIEALEALARAFDYVPEDGLLTNWVLVGSSVKADQPGYSCQFHHGADGQAVHVAVGLLEVGKARILAAGWQDDWDDDEEER